MSENERYWPACPMCGEPMVWSYFNENWRCPSHGVFGNTQIKLAYKITEAQYLKASAYNEATDYEGVVKTVLEDGLYIVAWPGDVCGLKKDGVKVKFVPENMSRCSYYKIGKYSVTGKHLTSLLEMLTKEQLEAWAKLQKIDEGNWIY